MKTTYSKLLKTTIFLIVFMSVDAFSQKKDNENENNTKKEKSYSDIITDKAVSDLGIFDVHKVDDKYYFELNDNAQQKHRLIAGYFLLCRDLW